MKTFFIVWREYRKYSDRDLEPKIYTKEKEFKTARARERFYDDRSIQAGFIDVLDWRTEEIIDENSL